MAVEDNLGKGENAGNLGKGENAGNYHFLFFLQCFHNPYSTPTTNHHKVINFSIVAESKSVC